ncbi:MAG: ABC transporter permease [Brevibacterium aurantiacum]|uniref:ABC transporter permease n=1 Tax=Brevibacterium aurantiacum TaxID=273384 RepID=A0A2A3ZV64_BREAU|nr:ABC transporter permease [Brevibacterium aurantiacum]AZL14372.1 ABC transporter permease [Brevibacterium aurantiacum]AZT94952.1 ABC transporter permease [Brevibacterium aurantiacum]PCC47445.1 sodium ABC transporter permease [Brevibacterium aurantiacum]PCC55205.1 sodium ABC transporter permease [Brevibacterium aurantiacum]RCS93430.1 ABC transporter permease [Brevibacterium aurantiacum]
MAGKDEGQDGDSPEPQVSKGTAGENIDDLGTPVGDDVTVTDNDGDTTQSTGTGAKSAKKASAARNGKSTKNAKGAKPAATADDDAADATDAADASDADAVAADDGLDEVPFELAEDKPSADELPETGLVSEFVDVNKRQAAWLVSNRESTTALRSPFFLVTGAVIVLGILAAIISGVVAGSDAKSGTPTMAMVGVGEQAAMYEQQLGVKITDAKDAQAAEKLVKEGKVDAAFIQDPSGQAQPTIIALDEQPEALLEKLAPKTEATLLNAPAVGAEIATPLLWGMAVFALLVVATLGTALYQNLRLEKRNRITEIIAATIPPRASASGRITGMLSLTAVHLVIAIVVAELGLSITGKTSLAFAMLPGLGWFALTLLFTAWTIYALLLWASTVAGSTARKIFVSIIGVITVAGFIAPVIMGASGMVAKVLSWTPFTSPLGIAGRFFASPPEWWEGLVAAAIAAVVALIVHSLASSAYVRAVLTGGGRGGKPVKMSKRAQKVSVGAAGKKETDSKDAAKDSDSDDVVDSDSADTSAGKSKADTSADETDDKK